MFRINVTWVRHCHAPSGVRSPQWRWLTSWRSAPKMTFLTKTKNQEKMTTTGLLYVTKSRETSGSVANTWRKQREWAANWSAHVKWTSVPNASLILLWSEHNIPPLYFYVKKMAGVDWREDKSDRFGARKVCVRHFTSALASSSGATAKRWDLLLLLRF